jgi:sugar O-acyltransferase (sialic acid O-acetyltransferase NeuD family)
MSGAPVILVGAGGHALVLLDALALNGTEILGLVDTESSLKDRKILGFSILGGDEVLRRHAPGSVCLVNAIGSVRSMSQRKQVYERFRREGHAFASVLHPSVTVSRHAVLANGVQIMAGAVVQPCASIGEDTIVNTGATVDHDCRIGAHVHLAPGVTLSGGVHIGDETHIGAGATIIQGVQIGARCTVGAGAVVLRNVADDSSVARIPARDVRQ